MRCLVYENILRNIAQLCDKVTELQLHYKNQACQQMANEVLGMEQAILLTTEKIWNEELARKLQNIWRDETTQFVYRRYGHHMMLTETIEYFMEDMDRIVPTTYCPSEDDVLRVMVKSTGLIELLVEDQSFRVVEMGGQRNERRKWMNQVSCHVFIVEIRM